MDQRGGIWTEKHHFDIRMKVIDKKRASRSTIHKKQNLERYGILQTVLFHFADRATQEGILEEELGHP